MIILTEDQAIKVRGISPKDDGAALEPRLLKDGTFILGEQVISDPAHSDVQSFLATLPISKATLIYEDDIGKIADIPQYQEVGERKEDKESGTKKD